MKRIGEILVAQGACTAAQVAEALQNRALLGGRLGTNLLELGLVKEEALAKALGERHHLPFRAGEVAIDPAVKALFTAEQVDRWEAIPLESSGRRLKVALVDPADVGHVDEMGFTLGKSIELVVMPESRVFLLMEQLYGVERQHRGLAESGRAMARAAAAAPKEAAPELMSEEEFNSLYADRSQVQNIPQPVAPPPGAPAAPKAPTMEGRSAPPPFQAPAKPAPPPAPAPVSVPGPPARKPAQPMTVDDLLDLVETSIPAAPLMTGARPVVPVAAPAPPPRPAPPPPPPPPPPLQPIGFAEATQLLEGVTDRDAIAHTVLRYAASRFKRAVLLTVVKDFGLGWQGAGLPPAVVKRLRIPLNEPSAFHTAVTTRAHVLGPLAKTEWNLRFLKALAGGAPKNALLIPILVGGRVVNVLYADAGRGGLVDPDVGELLILASKIAQSYSALLSRIQA